MAEHPATNEPHHGEFAAMIQGEYEQACKLIKDAGYEIVIRELFAAAKILEQPIYTKQYNVGNSIYGKKSFVILYFITQDAGCIAW